MIEGQDRQNDQVPIIVAFAGLGLIPLVQSSLRVHAKSSFDGTREEK